ncbi:hypothetical protein [Thiolapillus sp.]|uniref:hypothetical protein n=1 Tax=Thiolapillus sp. TaxID=2017437 RepID=UPI003AF41167
MTRTAGAPMGCQRPSRFWGLGCPKIYHEAEDTLVESPSGSDVPTPDACRGLGAGRRQETPPNRRAHAARRRIGWSGRGGDLTFVDHGGATIINFTKSSRHLAAI